MANGDRARRLVAFDLDGTALKMNQEMPPRTREALEAAHRMGCLLVVSTGRALRTVPRFLREAPWVDYLVVSNGARVVRARTGEMVFCRPIPPELALAVLAAHPEGAWQVHLKDRCLAEWRSLALHGGPYGGTRIPFLLSLPVLLTLFRPIRSAAAAVRRGGPVEKLIGVFPDPVAAGRALAQIQARGDLEAVTTTGRDVEVTAGGVSKGAALAWIAEREAVPKAGIIAFGDSGNDLSMAGAAGLFVAMGNAPPEVKEAAGAVAPAVDDDGLGIFLERWLRTGSA